MPKNIENTKAGQRNEYNSNLKSNQNGKVEIITLNNPQAKNILS